MDDKKKALALVKQNPEWLAKVSVGLTNDKEVVRAAVQQDGHILIYASAGLQNDEKVVLEAVGQDGMALNYASEELRNNRKVVLAAVKNNGGALLYVSDNLCCDKEVVLAAVAQNGDALKFAPDEFKNDCNVVLTAVVNNSSALKYAHPTLQASPTLHRVATVDENSRTADPATAWAADVEHQAITTPRWQSLQESPTLHWVATVDENSRTADPATAWAVDVEHQAITALAGNIELKPAAGDDGVRQPTEDSVRRLIAAVKRLMENQKTDLTIVDWGGNSYSLKAPKWWETPDGDLVAMALKTHPALAEAKQNFKLVTTNSEDATVPLLLAGKLTAGKLRAVLIWLDAPEPDPMPAKRPNPNGLTAAQALFCHVTPLTPNKHHPHV